jgi:hypothetical protein
LVAIERHAQNFSIVACCSGFRRAGRGSRENRGCHRHRKNAGRNDDAKISRPHRFNCLSFFHKRSLDISPATVFAAVLTIGARAGTGLSNGSDNPEA